MMMRQARNFQSPAVITEPAAAAAWEALAGWAGEDHDAALSCLRMSARAIAAGRYPSNAMPLVPALRDACIAALATEAQQDARRFFETRFRPAKIGEAGFVTGYYEPELAASRRQTARFRFPLYRRPDDLVRDEVKIERQGEPRETWFRVEGATRVPYFTRAEIAAGVLEGRGLELFWLESAADVFFVHVQGSARLALPDGKTVRIGYAARNGHPYHPIGRTLVARSELALEEVSMQSIRAWLNANPAQAQAVMDTNPSYIFFRDMTDGAPQSSLEPDSGPVGAAGVPLTAGRSLAIDPRHHAYATPIFVSVLKPFTGQELPFRRLMIAQDTGSAIIGPARGDIFFGSGHEAGLVAGTVRHDAEMFVLKAVDLQ